MAQESEVTVRYYISSKALSDKELLNASRSYWLVELIYAEDYQTIEEVRMGIFEYIEIYYNRNRKHSALGYVSPVAFESV
ncbi:transposase InsF for insertion sequence IS3A/B/C/D/E/fA [Vibrio cincinnatiensis]|uniref:Integrase core domain-containing protein n=1 Tax=Vibrio cincinnatiensis DSM 19608 TaxID=1123491 RepID=A0A1T4LI08_VIBCI|nr:Integrase core domain-containing protein [Vibrio cincinnatiensis DSM 19608]SUP05980.1 transposase InsF for insertion sequence IS3A/B/C/D/E/fA [Vibrio cincinnatiensis]